MCKNCKSKLKRNSKQFCSHQCERDFQYKIYIENWLLGKEPGHHKTAVSNHVKRWLIEKYGRKCQKCGWHKINPVTNKVPVQVNHKDGNWQNNRPENLELLCPNCHSLTPNFGALNKGHGRKYRIASVA